MNRILLLVALVLALVVLTLSGSVYASLPALIPTHFGMAGADRWMPRSFARWMSLPLLGIGLSALNYLMGALFAGRPGLINIPRKARLLALPRERQQHVMRWWWFLMQAIAIAELALLGVAQYGLWRAAVSQAFEGRLIGAAVGFVALGMVPLSLYIIWQMSAEIVRQEADPG